MTYVRSIPSDRVVFSWESQEHQYPNHGPEGLTVTSAHEIEPTWDGPRVDCLLIRNRHGRLIGILNHYPEDVPGLEDAGNFLVLVHPAYRRLGLGTELVRRAQELWNVRWEQQKLSDDGAALANAMSA